MKEILLILAIIGIAGCHEQSPTAVGKDTVTVYTDGHNAAVRIITTTDGTRCAVMVGYQRGGITCDWEGSRK